MIRLDLEGRRCGVRGEGLLWMRGNDDVSWRQKLRQNSDSNSLELKGIRGNVCYAYVPHQKIQSHLDLDIPVSYVRLFTTLQREVYTSSMKGNGKWEMGSRPEPSPQLCSWSS